MKAFILFSIFFMLGINAYCQTQDDLNSKAKSTYEKTDKELNQVYKEILKDYKSDTIFIKSLRIAQRQWIKFRDAQLNMKYPNYPNTDGSASSMCRYYYLKELTEERVKELRKWTDGIDEGDVCSGSIQLKK